MAGDLTGDFDVVVEFAVPAVNRVLAAMHRTGRVPHSLTLRVDDDPPPGSMGNRPSVLSSVGALGDVTVDHTQVGRPVPLTGAFYAADSAHSAFDPVVNAGDLVAYPVPVVPSGLQGVAQLQLSPPVIEVTDASGTNLTGRVQIMARYFPDPNTTPLPQFIRGELQMTASVNQVTSQVASVVDVDIKADQLKINFEPKWSSQPVSPASPLSAEDIAGINLLIRNALKTSLLPSNAAVPPNVKFIQFKTLLGGTGAIALLLNLNGARGNAGTANSMFLSAADDFAYAASRDYVIGAFQSNISQPIQYWVYTVSLKKVTLDLQGGKMVVTADGHAHTPKWYLPDFDFSIHQDLTLRPASLAPGDPLNTAELVPGEIGGGITGWLVSLFGGDLLTPPSQTGPSPQDTVRQMFRLDQKLGGFLNSLLKPADQQAGAPPQEDLKPALAYTSIDIQPSGIVARGTLAVADWPALHVEYAQIPPTSGGAGAVLTGGVFAGPDYSALKSWIPGGLIQSYEWKYQAQNQGTVDANRFVLLHSGPQATDGALSAAAAPGAAFAGVVSAYSPLCLTVRGSRLSSSGPVTAQPVSATSCGITSVSLIDGLEATPAGSLMVALTRRSPRGMIEVAGYAAPPDRGTGSAPNRVVHFADEKSADSLESVMETVRKSARKDAPAVVLAIVARGQLAKARYTEGVVYAEDHDRAWERAFGVGSSRKPLTLIVGPGGNEAWRHEGPLDRDALDHALRKHLIGVRVTPRIQGLGITIGRPAPNFLFEVAPGRSLTLRKALGVRAIVFWKCSLAPSIEAVSELARTARAAVLAVNDGDPVDQARRAASEHRIAATIVTDPRRAIARAYGVNVWPTSIFLDASGRVREIRYGRVASEGKQA